MPRERRSLQAKQQVNVHALNRSGRRCASVSARGGIARAHDLFRFIVLNLIDHDTIVGFVLIEGVDDIGVAGSNFRPSWRSLAYLPRGSYRYEATLKVAARGAINAILRTSGPWGGTTLNSATDWRPLTYDFEVSDEAGNDVEFVLEFNGAEGEAWFDLNTVRVRRLGP